MSDKIISSSPIAFMDSGIGGLPYLLLFREMFPGYSTLYFADHDHFPYGTRSSVDIAELVVKQAEKIQDRVDPVIFVLACNSASVSALEPLREALGKPVVGVVPAVKPAALESPAKRISLLATQRTIEAEYLETLIRDHASDCQVHRRPATELVGFIEEKWLNHSSEELTKLLNPLVEEMILQGSDRVVLGCTHFTYLQESIESLAKGKLRTVDSRKGVARQIGRILKELYYVGATQAPIHSFYTSKEREDRFYARLAEQYNLEYRGLL